MSGVGCSLMETLLGFKQEIFERFSKVQGLLDSYAGLIPSTRGNDLRM